LAVAAPARHPQEPAVLRRRGLLRSSRGRCKGGKEKGSLRPHPRHAIDTHPSRAAVARATPRYDLPRYAAPRYEPRYDSMERGSHAFLRQYGSYGSQEY